MKKLYKEVSEELFRPIPLMVKVLAQLLPQVKLGALVAIISLSVAGLLDVIASIITWQPKVEFVVTQAMIVNLVGAVPYLVTLVILSILSYYPIARINKEAINICAEGIAFVIAAFFSSSILLGLIERAYWGTFEIITLLSKISIAVVVLMYGIALIYTEVKEKNKFWIGVGLALVIITLIMLAIFQHSSGKNIP